MKTLVHRIWPYGVGLLICIFFAFAEREVRTLPGVEHADFWWGILRRFQTPIDYYQTTGMGLWAFIILPPMAVVYAVRPRWWSIPLVYISMTVWFIWGAVGLNRLG